MLFLVCVSLSVNKTISRLFKIQTLSSLSLMSTENITQNLTALTGELIKNLTMKMELYKKQLTDLRQNHTDILKNGTRKALSQREPKWKIPGVDVDIPSMDDILNQVTGVVNSAIDEATRTITDAYTLAVNGVQAVVNDVIESVSSVFNTISDVFTNAFGAISEVFEEMIKSIKGIVSSLVEIFQQFKTVILGVKDSLSGFLDNVTQFFQTIYQWIQDKIAFVVGIFEKAIGFVENIISKVVTFFREDLPKYLRYVYICIVCVIVYAFVITLLPVLLQIVNFIGTYCNFCTRPVQIRIANADEFQPFLTKKSESDIAKGWLITQECEV